MKNFMFLTLTALISGAPAFAGFLGTAETFAVLGASTVTNTGATQIRGNLGVSPGTAIVGFPPGIMEVGVMHSADAVAAQAQADLTTAYNKAAAMPCTFNMTGQDLGGLTLSPGVYCFDSSAQLTGALVLDFGGISKASFVFQIGSTLTTASSSTVSLENCVQNCEIIWQVGSSATLGTYSTFSGDILANASITITTGVDICGRALAETGAVTMDTDKVFFMGTLTPPAATMVTGHGQIAVPEPDSADPRATGAGRATFAFIAAPAGQGTFFNYLNSVTGVRVYGLIDKVEIIAMRRDGSAKTVRLSGACHASLPQCSFSATVERSEDPGGTDQFGVTIAGRVAEERSPRLTSSGQIQLH
jgi:ice-binding like protein